MKVDKNQVQTFDPNALTGLPNLEDNEGDIVLLNSLSHQGEINLGRSFKREKNIIPNSKDESGDIQLLDKRSYQGVIDIGKPLKRENRKN